MFEAQWKNGMLPSIRYNPDAKGHFLDPESWHIHRSPHAPDGVLTSAITQPPIQAAWYVYEHARDRFEAKSFLAWLFPKLVFLHDYLYTYRDPMWTNMNWMLLYHGLRAYRFHDYSEYVKNAIIYLSQRFGFREFYEPDLGTDHGAHDFCWTAALVLDLLSHQT